MERDRLHRDLVEKLEELKASRMRLVKIADEERRRLERNLHDGAQQRLTVALLALRRLEQQLDGDAELAALARSTRTELEAAIADLRELARGLHPPLLAKYGLARAVRAGAARSSIPVELDLRVDSGLPPKSKPPRTTCAPRRSRTPSSTRTRREPGSASGTRAGC